MKNTFLRYSLERKVFFVAILIFMAFLMGLSGCDTVTPPSIDNEVSEASPNVTQTALPEIEQEKNVNRLNTVLARVQKNINTGTFEGFKKGNTFQEVATCSLELEHANAAFAADFFNFSAKINFTYEPSRGNLKFYLMSDEWADKDEETNEILDKLDYELGEHTQSGDSYSWQFEKNTVNVQTNPPEDEGKSTVAIITIENPNKALSPLDIPGVFFSLFGKETNVEYENEMFAQLLNKGHAEGNFHLVYQTDDVLVRFYFMFDEATTSVVFTQGEYTYTPSIHGLVSSVDYIETCLSGLQNVLGDPDKCEYCLPDDSTVEIGDEIKQLLSDSFSLDASWDGISLKPQYDRNQGMTFELDFNENYFLNAYGYCDNAASGVTPAASQGTPEMDQKAKKFNSLLTKVEKNLDTNTFESFKTGSTFEEVTACGMKLKNATAIFSVNFFSFPANIYYNYYPTSGSIKYSVIPVKRVSYDHIITEIIKKMDRVLGKHTKLETDDGWLTCTWKDDIFNIKIESNANRYDETNRLATISIDNLDNNTPLESVPDIFFKLFGKDSITDNTNEIITHSKNFEIVYPEFSQTYLENGVAISFYFKLDDINNKIIFTKGEYSFHALTRGAQESANYMETCVSGLKNILGNPLHSDYYLPNSDISLPDKIRIESFKRIEELRMNSDHFSLETYWNDISLITNYTKSRGVEVSLVF